jgi:hypothetical protein
VPRPGQDPAGWITVDSATVDAVLPALQQFGHVFMGADKGEAGHALMHKLKKQLRQAPTLNAVPTSADAKRLNDLPAPPGYRPP